MKGCFVLQRNFAYIGHNLACLLKEKYGITKFCGYVYTRSSFNFLKSQTDITYTSLLLDSEIHDEYKQTPLDRAFLTSFEQEYGTPSAWPFIAIDRVLMHNQLVREYPYDKRKYSHEEMLRILQVHAKKILNFLDTEQPNFIIVSVIGGIGSLLLYHIAKKRGIKVIIINPASMKHRYVLSEKYTHLTGVDTLFAEYCSGVPLEPPLESEATKYLSEFRNAPHPYYIDASPHAQPVDRRRQFQFLLPRQFAITARLFFKQLMSYIKTDNRLEYDYISPWNYLRDASKRKIRNLIGVQDLYDSINPSDHIVFFPLQYEPEITTMLYAPYMTNQLNVIRNIARSIPVQSVLYVKEHPAMVVYRPRSFYKELKKIPNVKLINPAITSFEILKRAALITTITSTAGWEASLLGRPVITFGNVFYNSLPFVKHCTNIEMLPVLIKEQLEKFSYDESALLKFLVAILRESTVVNLQYLWEREQDMDKKKKGLEPLADLLAKKINQHC